MSTLYLFSTVGCHLCEQAQAIVEPLLPRYGLVLEVVDIADSEQLLADYGVRIPVLLLAGREDDLGWPFDQQMVMRYLRAEAEG